MGRLEEEKNQDISLPTSPTWLPLDRPGLLGSPGSWASATSIPFLYPSILGVAQLISGFLSLPCWLLSTSLTWVTNSLN